MTNFEKNLVSLPTDIIREICSLPSVEDLISLSCANKFLRNFIITDHFLAYSDIILAIKKNTHLPHDLITCRQESKKHTEDMLLELRNMKFKGPLNLSFDFRFHSSCNKITCFDIFRSDEETENCRWNLVLHQLRALQKDPNRPRTQRTDFIRYFYDADCQDYKIIRLLSGNKVNQNGEAEIYSLKNDSWSWIKHDMPKVSRSCHNPYDLEFNGCLYWICYFVGKNQQCGRSIISFDIVNHRLSEHLIPDYVPEGVFIGLGVIKRKLSFFLNAYNNRFEIWSMEEKSGISDSWTCNVLDYETLRSEHGNYFLRLTPDGKIFAIAKGLTKGIVYDIETRYFDVFEINDG